MKTRLLLGLVLLLPILAQEYPHLRGKGYIALPAHVLGKVKVFADSLDSSASPLIRAKGNVEIVTDTLLIQSDEVVINLSAEGTMDFKGETHLRRIPNAR